MNRLAARLAVVLCSAFVVMFGAAGVGAQSYPPSEVIIVTHALDCDATQVTGTIDGVQPGSQVTLTLTRPNVKAGFGPLKQQADAPVIVTADANKHVSFTIPLPAGVFGTFTLTATGTKAGSQEAFTVTSSVNVVPCPPLPRTGSDNTRQLLTLGGVALLGGIFLVVVAIRRRQAADAS